MLKDDVVRSWKDPAFKDRLSLGDKEAIPGHPCGEFDLTDEELAAVVGASTDPVGTSGCCSPASKNCGTCADGTVGCCSS